ncbi:hemerythrin HHE cation binding domain protein [Mycobacterium kansasii]|uniref:Hemerythrin HHE cation binding domain protein n=1 Tax=Mycobacterium kansasii TaxID=1768 RepID=A0A1V3WMQ1_MYCKA|nr:hemerythrin HHE cation binding domain protein [Mycobacterium kansasii]
MAMGARGATASSEAADIVLTTDRLDRLADAMDIARWSRRIAVQSAVVGMSLSLLAMAIAALGWLPPAAGALLQEGIDIAVIGNALRALRGNPATELQLAAGTEQLLHRFADEHDQLRDTIGLLRTAANRVAAGPDAAALASLTAAHTLLTERILPHEQAEEVQLYPALARPLGSGEATATMSRTHAEIQRLSDRIATHLALAQSAGQSSMTKSMTCWPACTACMRCCGCTSCRKRKATSPSPRTTPRPALRRGPPAPKHASPESRFAGVLPRGRSPIRQWHKVLRCKDAVPSSG